MPDFHIEAVGVLIGVNKGRFVARCNEGVRIDVFIQLIAGTRLIFSQGQPNRPYSQRREAIWSFRDGRANSHASQQVQQE